jgi:DNA-directed RNA polymerase specialized sigma24 family protein
MRVHRNAKTTPKMRQLIARRAQQGWTYMRIAEALDLSVRTVAKWVARARQAQITDRSSRPHRQPRRVAAPVERAIVTLRRTRATAWISAALGVPRSTVMRVLARLGLNRIALLEPAPPVQRYEWPHVGDLLHLDLKRLGRVTRVGHRIHGDRRRRGRRVGWEYLHVAIDDATRLSHAAGLAADDAPATARFLHHTLTNLAARMGLSGAVSELGAAHRRALPLSALLQPPSSPCEPRSSFAVDAFPRGFLR